ncbi:uncharacterized protein ISCGN_022666 [Ixodes scapularis]
MREPISIHPSAFRKMDDDLHIVSPPRRASRRRFFIEDDLLLLSAVQDIIPFADRARWAAVTRKLNEAADNTFTVRAVQDRCDLLIAQFRSQDRTNLRKSGTEEQYAKKEKLLQDISDLARAFGRLPKLLPRRAATCPSGTTGTEATQAASPGLSAAAQVRAVHAMRDAATSAAHEKHVAAAADHLVDENGRPPGPTDRPDFVPTVFNDARAPGESAVQSQDPFLERHKGKCDI